MRTGILNIQSFILVWSSISRPHGPAKSNSSSTTMIPAPFLSLEKQDLLFCPRFSNLLSLHPHLQDPHYSNSFSGLLSSINGSPSNVAMPGARQEIPPMTRSCGRDLLSKASGLEGPHLPDLLKHLPQNQNLSVLLFYVFHQLF